MSDEPEVHVEALCSKILEKANHYDSLFDKARIQTIRVKTDQKLADLERLRKLKDEHKKLDYDLRMAQFVKTCKYVKRKNIQESISATKARVEELRRIVQEWNALDSRIEELMPQQFDDVEKFDDTDGRNFEAALLWYRNVLGFRTEGGEGVKFFFSKIDHKNPDKEFSFTIRLEGETYKLLKCDPLLRDTPRLIKELNETHSFFKFVRAMREKFLAYALYGEVLIEGDSSDGLYKLPVQINQMEVNQVIEGNAMARTWHHRLRHLHTRAMKSMLIFSDVWGPAPCSSNEGKAMRF